jgi:hypothetical protein
MYSLAFWIQSHTECLSSYQYSVSVIFFLRIQIRVSVILNYGSVPGRPNNYGTGTYLAIEQKNNAKSFKNHKILNYFSNFF